MTEIGRSGFTAIWFNPDGKLRDFAPGVSRFLKDAEEIVPESKGNWFIIEENRRRGHRLRHLNQQGSRHSKSGRLTCLLRKRLR